MNAEQLMNFEQAAAKVGTPINSKYCKFVQWQNSLEFSDRETVKDYIVQLREGTAEISGGWLYRVCRTMGLELAQSRFYFHLSGECKCPK